MIIEFMVFEFSEGVFENRYLRLFFNFRFFFLNPIDARLFFVTKRNDNNYSFIQVLMSSKMRKISVDSILLPIYLTRSIHFINGMQLIVLLSDKVIKYYERISFVELKRNIHIKDWDKISQLFIKIRNNLKFKRINFKSWFKQNNRIILFRKIQSNFNAGK